MVSKLVAIQSDVLERLEQIEGSSYTKKIENLMNIQTAAPVDYNKIKEIVSELKDDPSRTM